MELTLWETAVPKAGLPGTVFDEHAVEELPGQDWESWVRGQEVNLAKRTGIGYRKFPGTQGGTPGTGGQLASTPGDSELGRISLLPTTIHMVSYSSS